MHISPHVRLLLFILLSASLNTVIAQQKKSREQKPICDQQRAIAIVEKQAEDARTFEKGDEAVKVMIRSADLLWPYREKEARSIFSEAYDLAGSYYKNNPQDFKQDGRMHTISLPDQRFVVLNAIAKRDPDWARKLAGAVSESLKDVTASTSQTAAKPGSRPDVKASRPDVTAARTGGKFVDLADTLTSMDQSAATDVFRTSFRYPASLNLPRFLFKLAGTDRAVADKFFSEALAAYSNGSVDDFVYLSSYAFGASRGLAPSRRDYTVYSLPAGYSPNPDLQRAFIMAFFQFADARLAVFSSQEGTDRYPLTSEQEQIYAMISSLEPLVAQSFPTLQERVTVLKTQAAAAISDEKVRKRADLYRYAEADQPAGGLMSFENRVEEMEKTSDVTRRDQSLTFLVVGAGRKENIDALLKAADLISDPGVRDQLIEWIYIVGTQKKISDGLFDDAEKTALKITEIDQRGAIQTTIAAEYIKKFNDRAHASQLLADAFKTVSQAPDTVAKAKALLGLAFLFTSADQLRASEVAAAAVQTINNLDSPDLSGQYLTRKIESKNFASFASTPAPGFDLESTFLKLGADNFDNALWIADKLKERPLKARAMIAVATECLGHDKAKPAAVAK
jgi:hypothetical protein